MNYTNGHESEDKLTTENIEATEVPHRVNSPAVAGSEQLPFVRLLVAMLNIQLLPF